MCVLVIAHPRLCECPHFGGQTSAAVPDRLIGRLCTIGSTRNTLVTMEFYDALTTNSRETDNKCLQAQRSVS